ncbi:30S ribosomal protein S16 [Patescibacteria group bacterium]|nr:30S ribosomal protein S16 [Patescibacteria group bacterium]
MLTIRLSRVGKKNRPTYRIVISEKAKDPYGRALEILGSYDPHNKNLKVDGDRVRYWIEKGSQMSTTINNLFIDNKIIEGEKKKATKTATKKNIAKQKAAEKDKKAKEEAKKEEESKEEKKEDVKEEAEKKENNEAEEVKNEEKTAEK